MNTYHDLNSPKEYADYVIETAKEIAGAILLAVLAVGTFILYLAATPDQWSAERDLCAYEMEQAEKGAAQ